MDRSYGPANLHADSFLLEVNPYVRLAYYDILPPYKKIAQRIIYDYEIVLLKSGTATITVEDQVYKAGPGDLFIFKPGQLHSFLVNEEELVQPHVHFDMKYLADNSEFVPISFKNRSEMTDVEKEMIRPDITEFFITRFPNYIHLQNPIHIEQLLFDVIDAYGSPSVFPEIRLKWCFLRLLEQVLCEIKWRDMDPVLIKDERAVLIKQYLDYHTERQIKLDELAEVYHIDKSYISKIFRERYDISPMRYHLMQRMEKAKKLIRCTNISLTQIAEQTGFSCLQDFSRAFHQMMGVAPSEYRKRHTIF